MGCTGGETPEKTVAAFLQALAQKDFPAVEGIAPFFADLPEEQKIRFAENIGPYASSREKMEKQQLGLGRYTIFLSTGRPGDKTLILTLTKGEQGAWLISEEINYKQSFDFIPLKKQ